MDRIDETRLLVSLTGEDMKAFDLEYDQFLWTDKHSKIVVRNLLDIAKKETGFYFEGKKLMIEVIPKASGCVLLFTLLDKEEKKRKVYKIKRKEEPSIYVFSDIENVLLTLERLTAIKNHVLKNALIQYGNKYFMVIYTEYGLIPQVASVLGEYGDFCANGKIVAAKLFECGNVIEENNAIDIIGSCL